MRGISEERLIELFNSQSNESIRIILAALVDECQELNRRQPIESAPIQEKLLLIRKSDNGYVLAKVYSESDREFYTHWMELPTAPELPEPPSGN